MPPMATRRSARSSRLQPDDRIAEIMAHARRELAERGHESFLTAGVAERASVSEATIYRYFPTKRDLLLRVAEEWFGEILSLEPQLARQTDVFDQLRLVIRHSFEVLRQEPSLSRFVLMEMRTDPAYRSTEIYALNRRFTSTVVTVIEHGIAEGALRDDVSPKLVRDMVFGCIEHRAWSYLQGRRDFDVKETADTIARIVLSGLAAVPLRDRRRVDAALAELEAKASLLHDDIDSLRAALGRERD
jgi:TetR/AcrR family fatty acid metabolism transcriptional regulator